MNYQTFTTLSQQQAKLQHKVTLNSGIALAMWSNQRDTITVNSDHHTLSLYIEGGYQTYQKCANTWRNGGGPDKLCLMPQGIESQWDIRGPLKFVHLYCTDRHLQHISEQIWDRTLSQFSLREISFQRDDKITAIYRHILLTCDWQDSANYLTLSSANTLLLTHLLQHYSDTQWQLPTVTGGLAPHTLQRIIDYIEANLAEPLTLSLLAEQAMLSEFHFSRMFTHSMGIPPHRYVMSRRLRLAKELILYQHHSFTTIAHLSGFSSASHLSQRIKQDCGLTPTELRHQRNATR